MTDAPPPMAEGRGLARSAGAIAGLKVIDLTRILGGPYCTMVLSDHGARRELAQALAVDGGETAS